MALSRKSLKAMGLTDEQVDSIIEMHTETVDGLKDAEPMGEGVTVESLSSAVRVKLSIETPLDARRQFFKVGLGD